MNNTAIRQKAKEIVKLWNNLPKSTQQFLMDSKDLGVNRPVAQIFKAIDNLAKEIQRGKTSKGQVQK